MKLTNLASAAMLAALLIAPTAWGAELSLSIGIRETGDSNGPIGGNGGFSGGIEFVNIDGQTLIADGTWQLFTFTPATDTLTAFAGASANGALDVDWGTLEHVRIRNTADGFTRYNVWIDDITNTDSTGAVNFGDFEAFNVGDEVIFQEPRFSGTTSGNLLMDPNSSLVTDLMAFTGTNSDAVQFEFASDADTPANWVRLTTFNTPNLPNPRLHLQESVVGGPPIPTTISFYAKAVAIPEPSSIALGGLALVGLALARRRS